jgi:putative MATE family efflux protein
MCFGVVALLGFQLVDSAFVARLGVTPLAALGFTVPVMQLVIGVQVGVGIATTAVLSRVLGRGERDRAQRLGGLVVVAGALVMLALAVALWLGRHVLMAIMGAEADIGPVIDAYWVPWLISAWLGAVLYIGYSVCRAYGDTRLPGLFMVITSGINLALDPLFIFTLDWGLPGAAGATIVAFASGAAVVYAVLARRRWVAFDITFLPPLPALGWLASIAGPAMVSQLMPPAAAVLATGLVARFGSDAVGAWGLGSRLEFFSIVVVLALTMSLPPMIARAVGAGDLARVRALVRLSVGFVLAWQLVIAAVWLVGHAPLAGLLATDPAVKGHLAAYLVRVPLSYSGLGVCMLMVSTCNALGMPLRAVMASLVRLFICFLPALWLGASWGGLSGLFNGALVGNLAAGLAGWLIYAHAMRRLGY